MEEDFFLKLLINDGAMAGVCLYLIHYFGARVDKITDSINLLADKLGTRLDHLERDVHELRLDKQRKD